MNCVRIGEKQIGPGHAAYVVAEAGINHNGSRDTALRLVDVAAEAGCDAVKFQKREIRSLLSREAYEAPYLGRNSYGRNYGEHREKLELTPEDYSAIRDHARSRGLHFLASAWDSASASFVDSLGVPAHKIGSPDLTNLPLCAQIAAFDKPVLLSTGMSELWELDAAVRVLRDRNSRLVLLHCVSIYPAPHADLRLGCIPMLRERYDLPVGYSGHEPGWHAAIAAVALGACVIEKHFTLDRSMKGGDHGFSLEPAELRAMVAQIRETEAALVGQEKFLLAGEIPFRKKLGKSVTTRVRVPKGAVLTQDMLTCKSPATGLSPVLFHHLLGRRTKREIGPDTVIGKEDVA